MPKDGRLYMTFPIDFDDHPKVAPLSDAAFRTFVAMNGYSRVHRLDGRIPVAAARKKWKPRALAELVASHPERPLVLLDGDVYVLREYASHQFTTADEESLRAERSAAGAAGGKASAIAKANRKQMLQQTASKVQAESESRSESGILTDVTYLPESSHLRIAGAVDSDQLSDSVAARAARIGIADLAGVRRQLERAIGQPVSRHGAVLLAEAITSKAPGEVRNVDAYVAKACRTTPAELKEAYFDLDIGAVA